MKIPVYCEICSQKIAVTDPEELKSPMKGNMFQSHLAGNGVYSPFHPEADWEFMKCPYCGYRPFLSLEKVLTDLETGRYHTIGETYHKPESDKTPHERNQEAIDAAFPEEEPEAEPGQTEIPEEPEEEPMPVRKIKKIIERIIVEPPAPEPEPEPVTYKCKYCGKPYVQRISFEKHEADCRG